jgi:hypothetical protein
MLTGILVAGPATPTFASTTVLSLLRRPPKISRNTPPGLQSPGITAEEPSRATVLYSTVWRP